MKTPIIYYLEDNDADFEAVRKNASKYLKVEIFPRKNRTPELRLFKELVSKNDNETKKKIETLLLENKIDLLILDQQINGTNSVGSVVYNEIIFNNAKLSNIKVIIYSKATKPQLPLREHRPGEVIELYKGSKQSAEQSAVKLLDQCVILMDIPKTNLIEQLIEVLNKIC